MATTVVNLRRGPYDVYIGRGRGSIWGNPFRIGPDGDRATVLKKYREWLLSDDPQACTLRARLPELRDKRLGCFCKPQGCHGDILAELADSL